MGKKTLINIGRKIPVSFGFWESPLQLLCYGSLSMTRTISKNSFFFLPRNKSLFVEAKHVPGQTLSWYKSAQLQSEEVRQDTLPGLPALFLQGMSVNSSWITNNVCYKTRRILENNLQEKSF